MIPFIKVNGSTYVPSDTIKYVSPLSDEERDRVSKKYDIDASKFNSQLHLTTQQFPMLTQETTKELSDFGLNLVTLHAGHLVPAEHIGNTFNLSKSEIKDLEDKNGEALSKTFRSKVETSTGVQWSTAYPAQVLERKQNAKLKSQNTNSSTGEAPADPAAE